MARPQKRTIDYFPHWADSGKTLMVLQNELGNDGYAFWFKLQCLLCKSDGQVYDYRNPAAWRLLLAETHVSEDIANKALQLLAELEAIDPELYQNKVIWVQQLVDDVGDVYRRRRDGSIPERPVIVDKNLVNVNKSTQTRQDKTRQDNIYCPESQEFKLASMLKGRILENNPRARVPSDLQKWCREFDFLLNKNGYQLGEVEAVIDYCQTSSFWRPNILSAGKLREKFDTLHGQSKEKQKGDTHGKTRHSRDLPTTYTPPPVYDDD